MSCLLVWSLRRRYETKARKGALTTALIGLQLVSAFAWVFPEHRDIAALAVQRLDPKQQTALQKLWSEARSGHEARLCEQVADTAQGAKPTCIDFAAWTAIAGDHSCSAGDMLNTVLNAPWILGVAGVSARLKTQLAAAERRDQRVNAVRASDLALQRTDPEYVTRASSNNAYFMLARADVAMEPKAYAVFALGPKADLNSIATYAWYHLRAIAKAAYLARRTRSSVCWKKCGSSCRSSSAIYWVPAGCAFCMLWPTERPTRRSWRNWAGSGCSAPSSNWPML
jgi:hypothetical protein